MIKRFAGNVTCLFVSQHSVVDDPVSEAVCIIADTDSWLVASMYGTLAEKLLHCMWNSKQTFVIYLNILQWAVKW